MTALKTFFLYSGLPFFTETRTISPREALGNLFNLPEIPKAAMIFNCLAPVLSAQLSIVAVFSPIETLNLIPTLPERPLLNELSQVLV